VSNFASSLGRPVYTGLKQMKGLAPHPWAVAQPTGQSLKWMRECVGGEGSPPPSSKGASNLQPVLRHASVVSAQNWLTGELCVAVSPISWQRNLNLCGWPRSSSESRRPLDVISVCTRPGQHVTDRRGPYQPQVPGAEFGLGVRLRLALTSIGVPDTP
jgi:hypothetical protein